MTGKLLSFTPRHPLMDCFDILAAAYCAESKEQEDRLMREAIERFWERSDETFKTLFVAMKELLVARTVLGSDAQDR